MSEVQTELEVREISIEKIKIPGHKRIKPEKVTALTSSIKEVGLLHPITIDKNFESPAGAHRVEAYKSLDRKTIPAIIFRGDKLHARLAGIDENLIGPKPTALERSQFLAERKKLIAQIHPESLKKGRPKKGEIISSFSRKLAREMGISTRTIEQEIQIAESIPLKLQERIELLPLADSKMELLKLSKRPQHEQEKIVSEIESGRAKTIDKARANLTLAKEHKEWGQSNQEARIFSGKKAVQFLLEFIMHLKAAGFATADDLRLLENCIVVIRRYLG